MVKIVEVIWVDIEELAGGWHDLDEVEEHVNNEAERTVKMVGYLFEEDEEKVTLYDSKMGSNFYGTVNVIPKSCIKSMRVLC